MNHRRDVFFSSDGGDDTRTNSMPNGPNDIRLEAE